jgi:Arginase family
VRSASVLLRRYNPELRIDVSAVLSVVDHGDAPTVPGYHEETLAWVAAFRRRIHERGVIPLCVGGDHSIALAELRAAAAVHGPLALFTYSVGRSRRGFDRARGRLTADRGLGELVRAIHREVPGWYGDEAAFAKFHTRTERGPISCALDPRAFEVAQAVDGRRTGADILRGLEPEFDEDAESRFAGVLEMARARVISGGQFGT